MPSSSERTILAAGCLIGYTIAGEIAVGMLASWFSLRNLIITSGSFYLFFAAAGVGGFIPYGYVAIAEWGKSKNAMMIAAIIITVLHIIVLSTPHHICYWVFMNIWCFVTYKHNDDPVAWFFEHFWGVSVSSGFCLLFDLPI